MQQAHRSQTQASRLVMWVLGLLPGRYVVSSLTVRLTSVTALGGKLCPTCICSAK
ncbi:hypothetical protein GALMADRAFT_1311242 [Galerina marginata CBS 339.88]|uniref:Uncharacterized protein n=1 Tax=Galerina marginata (strain CBS 339.88) TaxID=685588 RepID=A0A067T509_GALM3|nr:hypothetical protein GALMADRAFT_1311242 [Galerina marginata CBS 339.88]